MAAILRCGQSPCLPTGKGIATNLCSSQLICKDERCKRAILKCAARTMTCHLSLKNAQLLHGSLSSQHSCPGLFPLPLLARFSTAWTMSRGLRPSAWMQGWWSQGPAGRSVVVVARHTGSAPLGTCQPHCIVCFQSLCKLPRLLCSLICTWMQLQQHAYIC